MLKENVTTDVGSAQFSDEDLAFFQSFLDKISSFVNNLKEKKNITDDIKLINACKNRALKNSPDIGEYINLSLPSDELIALTKLSKIMMNDIKDAPIGIYNHFVLLFFCYLNLINGDDLNNILKFLLKTNIDEKTFANIINDQNQFVKDYNNCVEWLVYTNNNMKDNDLQDSRTGSSSYNKNTGEFDPPLFDVRINVLLAVVVLKYLPSIIEEIKLQQNPQQQNPQQNPQQQNLQQNPQQNLQQNLQLQQKQIQQKQI